MFWDNSFFNGPEQTLSSLLAPSQMEQVGGTGGANIP